MKDAVYFSHDSNARNDFKTVKLRAKFNWHGYGLYWAIIEVLRDQKDYKWPSEDKEFLVYTFASGDPVASDVLDYCITIGLLVDDGEFIYSDSLHRRMEFKDAEREKKRRAGQKSGEVRRRNSINNSVQKSNEQKTNTVQQEDEQLSNKERKKETKERKKVNKESSSTDDAVEDGGFQNPAFGTVATFIEQNIQPLTPSVGDQVGELIDLYNDAPLIIEAFKVAVNSNARNKFKYAETTLRNWKAEFVTDISQLEAKRSREQPRQYNKAEKDLFAPSQETLELERQQYKEVLKDYVQVGDPFA